jgi:hypothetical protein
MDESARSRAFSPAVPRREAGADREIVSHMRLTALFLFLFVFGLTTIIVLEKTELMPILTDAVSTQVQAGLEQVF